MYTEMQRRITVTASAAIRPKARRLPSALALFESLATPHGLDRYLELVNPMLSVRELRAQVTNVCRSTTDTVTLTLRPTRHWRGFHAGQFVQVTVEIDGVRRTRCYSPACSQYRPDGRIELTVKAHPEGVVSRYLHAHATPGLVVGLSQADGTFQLPAVRPDKVLLISGGSGITPVLSMLRTLADEGYCGDTAFLHYGYTETDVAYLDELRDLAFDNPNVRLVFAYTEAHNGELSGFFCEEHLSDAAHWYADAETFLCGPPGLMKSVRAFYNEAGLADKLHVEDFAPALIAAPTGEVTGEIAFTGSAITAANDGRSLLEQAEDAGLSPEYGCRMGICFSCTRVKTAGCTQNLLTGEIESDLDIEIQLCISVPVGDVAITL
jgi:ferredoxin-NADP reductase